MSETIHNIDQYMSDLRQILAQGKKRIGVLLGAGASAAIDTEKDPNKHTSLIPAISELTDLVKKNLSKGNAEVLESLGVIKDSKNIEEILSKVRSISSALKDSDQKIGKYGLKNYDDLAEAICQQIGSLVKCKLPSQETAYNRLAAWMGGTDRSHAVEIFTSNYDLLMEEALENAKIPYFAGFSGSDEPDPPPINESMAGVNPANVWTIYRSEDNGKKTLYGGANHRIFAPSGSDDRARQNDGRSAA